MNRSKNILNEKISLPIEIGDTVLMGKFKNKPVVVKDIDWNEKGDLLINGKSAMRMRIPPKQNIFGENIRKEIMKKLEKKLYNIIMESEIIKYRSKDGESKEMSADAAKRQPEDHPAKQAWLKTQSSGDSPEKSTEPKGADLFKTKEPASGDEDDRDEDKEEMAVDMNLNDSMAMDYEEDIEEVLSDSLGGEAVEVAFDGFDRRGNPIYVIEFEEGGSDKEITVNQKTGAIYDYDVDGVQGFDKDGTVYGTIGENTKSIKSILVEYNSIIIEANRYPTVSNKFKNALDRLPEKYFNRKGVLTLIKKLNEKDPKAAMAYTMDAFGWMKGMKEAFASYAQQKAAYASGYKGKGKKRGKKK